MQPSAKTLNNIVKTVPEPKPTVISDTVLYDLATGITVKSEESKEATKIVDIKIMPPTILGLLTEVNVNVE